METALGTLLRPLAAELDGREGFELRFSSGAEANCDRLADSVLRGAPVVFTAGHSILIAGKRIQSKPTKSLRSQLSRSQEAGDRARHRVMLLERFRAHFSRQDSAPAWDSKATALHGVECASHPEPAVACPYMRKMASLKGSRVEILSFHSVAKMPKKPASCGEDRCRHSL